MICTTHGVACERAGGRRSGDLGQQCVDRALRRLVNDLAGHGPHAVERGLQTLPLVRVFLELGQVALQHVVDLRVSPRGEGQRECWQAGRSDARGTTSARRPRSAPRPAERPAHGSCAAASGGRVSESTARRGGVRGGRCGSPVGLVGLLVGCIPLCVVRGIGHGGCAGERAGRRVGAQRRRGRSTGGVPCSSWMNLTKAGENCRMRWSMALASAILASRADWGTHIDNQARTCRSP
jgi:hypothetical protein